jgi:DNA mismatch repair ATPase MutS
LFSLSPSLSSFLSSTNETPTEEAYFDDSNIPVPLYKLRLGVNRHSGGINCAESCGLSSSIIHRANEIATTLSHHSIIEPLKKYQTQQMNKILEKKDLLKLFFSVENWEESTDGEIEQIRRLLGVGEKR